MGARLPIGRTRRVQEYLVCQGQPDLGQVQADKRWCRSQRSVLWLATVVRVFSRLLIWGGPSRQAAQRE